MTDACLYVVTTPIGNLGDLSTRMKEVLEACDLIAAEDTRRCRNLMNYLGFKKRIVRCDEEKEASVTPVILSSLKEGKNVCLVSDAGAPGVSDPGSRLVHAVRLDGHPVIPIPGPSAITAALSSCGFRAVPFRFYGFIPKKGKIRKTYIAEIAQGSDTSVFFESPYRIEKTLTEIAELAPERQAYLARELTKLNEEHLRMPLSELVELLRSKKIKGECTIVVEPLSKKKVRPTMGSS